MASDNDLILVTEKDNEVFSQNPTVLEIHYAKIEATEEIANTMMKFVKQTGLQVDDVRIRYRFSEWTGGSPAKLGKKMTCDVFLDVKV
jgi:hypothetical protein